MREAEFRSWLRAEGYSSNTVNTQLTQAKRIDQAYGDLDSLFAGDGFASLRRALAYSAADRRAQRPNPAGFPINGDLYANLASYRATLTYYERFAGTGRQGAIVDRQALERLKGRFLTQFPDFESGGAFAGSSRYHAEEDDYKRKLVLRVGDMLRLEPPLDDATLGAAILDGLSNETNLLGYYNTVDSLKGIRAGHPGIFEEATGILARNQDPPGEAAEAYLKVVWPLLLEASPGSRPFGDSRIHATVVQALARPETAISVIYQRYFNLGMALLGRAIFGNNVLTAAEYDLVLELARAIFTVMDGEWGWRPRDLWDVQGFIWVTCKDKLEGGAMGPAIDRSAVEAAMDECASLGESPFVAKYGRSLKGVRYRVVRDGVRYPSKAIANAAYQNLHSEPGPYGGSQARQVLAALGYEIVEGDSAGSDDEEVEDSLPLAAVTNLILYGPPGTGKTYATAQEAVRLCDGGDCDDGADQDRAALMERYRALLDSGRIEFATFHQSFSYEEFVEGLRPSTGGDEEEAEAVEGQPQAGFTLQPEPGIFHRIARRAETSGGSGASAAGAGHEPVQVGDRRIFKMSIGEAANPEDAFLFEEAIDGGYTLLGWDDIDWSNPRFESRDAIIASCREHGREGDLSASSGAVQMPYIFRNWVKEGDIVVVSKGNSLFRAIGIVTGGYEFAPREGGDYAHRRGVDWLWVDRTGVPVSELYPRNFMQKTIYLLYKEEVNVAALERYMNSQRGAGEDKASAKEPFVLIIDEINRANISKVFGELITLIEPDKRLGQVNELRVRLPYSKKMFGVPANLHIIGTMNTADRSIALLDTALRRRFEFRELMPKPSLLGIVEEIDLGALLRRINARIEYLFDREHQIGHAYFMGCATRRDVDQVMRHKVIPLLAEYFYEDWNKVALVLGDGAADGDSNDRGGAFLDRVRLAPPAGLETDDGTAPRWRWSVATEFDYSRLAAPLSR